MDTQTDEEILAAHAQGDTEAFPRIVERYLQTIYSFVVRLVGEPREAEDITQDVFLKIWKNIKKYDPQSSRFKTWSLRIARNTAIDYLRRKKFPVFSEFETAHGGNAITDTLADGEKLADELFADTQDACLLAEAVLTLSPPHREVLALHYTSHLTFEEISSVLGEPQNTVKSRHRRALITLRKVLESQAPNHD